MMSIYDKIQAGHYATKKPYPDRLQKPPGRIESSRQITDAQLEEYRRIRDEYNEKKEQYDIARKEHIIDENRLVELFWSDLADELGIDKADPFFSEFRRICWEQGHSSGLNEVYNYVMEYRTLIDLYLAKQESVKPKMIVSHGRRVS